MWCLISDTEIQDSSANTGNAHAHMCSCAKSYENSVALDVWKKTEVKQHFNITKAPLVGDLNLNVAVLFMHIFLGCEPGRKVSESERIGFYLDRKSENKRDGPGGFPQK